MKRLFSVFLSIGLFVFGAGLGVKRGFFLLSAERTTGSVEAISASNGKCGSKSNKHDCTHFSANVVYSATNGTKGRISVGAGDARGHNQSVTLASLKPGTPVPVIYSPSDISNAFHDTFLDLWMIPLGSLLGSGFCMIGAIRQR